MTKGNPHIGSSFDSFLDDEGLLEQTEATAIKRVIAYRLRRLLAEREMTKADLADAMETSRAAVDRLLDTDNTSVTLLTLVKATVALGAQVRLSLVARPSGTRAAAAPRRTRADRRALSR